MEAAAQAEQVERARREEIRRAQEATVLARKAEEKKVAADSERSRSDKLIADIAAKRKQITQIESALHRFEEEHRLAAMAAIRAKKENKMVEVKSHMRNVTRLKTRIAQYQNQVVNAQTQLDALEDVALQRESQKNNQAFVANLGDVKVDADSVENTLQDMRETLESVNEVSNVVQADMNLNKNAYDDDLAMEELEALEAQYTEEASQGIPSVPQVVPNMPAAAAAAPTKVPSSMVVLNDKEEEEMRKLEADMAL